MQTYNLKIYHPEDRSFHQVAHNICKKSLNNLVSICESHNRPVLIELNFNPDEPIKIDLKKLEEIFNILVLDLS